MKNTLNGINGTQCRKNLSELKDIKTIQNKQWEK